MLAPKLNNSLFRPERVVPFKVREITSRPKMAALDLVLAVGVLGLDIAPVLKLKRPNC
jgi:hypothetical protein